MQGKQRSERGAHRLHQDTVELKPIRPPHQRPQVGHVCLPVRQHSTPAFLFHHCRKRAEPTFPLLAKTLRVQYQFSVGKASCHDQRVQHPLGVVASPIQDRLEQGLKRGQRQMRDIVFLAVDHVPLKMDVAVVHHKRRDTLPLIQAGHQSFAQGSCRNARVIPNHHDVQVRVCCVARDERAQQVDQGELAERFIRG